MSISFLRERHEITSRREVKDKEAWLVPPPTACRGSWGYVSSKSLSPSMKHEQWGPGAKPLWRLQVCPSIRTGCSSPTAPNGLPGWGQSLKGPPLKKRNHPLGEMQPWSKGLRLKRGEGPTSVLTVRNTIPGRSERRRWLKPPAGALRGTPRPWTVTMEQNDMKPRQRRVVSHGTADHRPVLRERGQNKHKAMVCRAEAVHGKGD